MKIRYYLRGLGLGVLVTAIFFMVSDSSSGSMSDEQIKKRARELGMTESVVLAELSNEEETLSVTEEAIDEEITVEESVETLPEEASIEEVVETSIEETTIEEASVEESLVEEMTVEEIASEEETIAEPEEIITQESVEEEQSVSTNTEAVSIVVNRGDGSDTVSKRMQDAGLVADAYEYDRYLMANGYDKRIGAGEHLIPAGATWEDMAKILCNMK